MYEFELDLTADTSSFESTSSPHDVSFEVLSPSAVRECGYDLDFSIPVDLLRSEWALVALADGEPIGRTLVSAGAEPYIHALERRMAFPGAYVRRVFVAPDWRTLGLGTQLLGRALAVAHDELCRERASALVAVDNRPSQWLFEGWGFERVRVHSHARVGRFSRSQSRLIS